ncbi:MAG: helicase-exonuclease AddAB subunit AddA [Clostridia bacterium]
MIAWTDEQMQAIALRGENLLLSAAAGSGKTTVLVERVLGLIQEGFDVDGLLIVTFSRAAAADMKEKLARKLTLLAQHDARMLRQLELLDRASVETLHAYCVEVLRGHFEVAGVDPAFRVPDDPEARQIEARALADTLEDACADPSQDFLQLDFGRDISQIGKLTLALYHFSEERPDPEAWLRQACEALPSGDCGAWMDALIALARGELEEARGLCEYALALARQPDGPKAYEQALESDIVALDQMSVMGYEALQAALARHVPEKLKPLRAGDDDALRMMGEQVKLLRQTAKERVAKVSAMLPDAKAARADMRLSLPTFRALEQLVLDFSARLALYKSDRSVLTFNDLEHAALSALRDPGVAQAQRARFTHVFIDEYQDVTDLQEALIAQVARPGRLFMVGDVKQSIYRFRQAEPTLFIERYRRYGAGQVGKLISLTRNFRSRGAIIHFVNAVFERVMSGERAEVEYDEAARLAPGATFEGRDPAIEAHILTASGGQSAQALQDEGDEDDEDGEATGAHPGMRGTAAREGALIAQIIARLIGTPLFEGSARLIRPGDIAVLARTRSSLSACERLLREAGIAAYADLSDGYLGALEVRTVLALMECVANGQRDFPLLATLRSPIVNLTSTQLGRIRAAHPEGTFVQAALSYQENKDVTAQKLRKFFADVERLRLLSRVLPLPEWLDLALRESGYYAYVGGMAGGRARQANLDLLSACVSQFEGAQAGGLGAFLDYVREVGALDADMGAAHAQGDLGDVVRLMTAHKAKGLEFPVVIATGLGRKLAGRHGEAALKMHRTLGAGLWYHDPALSTKRDTIARRAIEAAQAREALEEEKRILYVMLTRARDRLILVGTHANRAQAELTWQVSGLTPMRPESFLDMVMPALLACAQDDLGTGEAAFDEAAFEDAAGTGDAQIRAQISWHDEEVSVVSAPEHAAQAPDVQDVARAREALRWRYPFEGEAFQPVKLTVSGLTREAEGAHVVPSIERRPKFLGEKGMTGAEKGTLLHAALSQIELASLRGKAGAALVEAVDAQVSALLTRGVLLARVDARPIAAFFERAMGRRLLAATRVEREWPFNLRMTVQEALGTESEAEIVVQGVVDCCFIEEGAWVLLDYKTDRLDDEALLKKYSAQIKCYQSALERITHLPVKECALCLLSAAREIAL